MTPAPAVGTLDPADCARRLASAAGVSIRTGPFTTTVQTRLPDVARAFHTLYRGHALAQADEVIDFEVAVRRPRGLRRWRQPQVAFEVDGRMPFNPLPGDQGFPLLEWGMNWCVYANCHRYLILHAAVLERHGRALILPAPSGSGKSTLCAGLLFHGWRLLSDELTLVCPRSGHIVPVPRPVSLKNASIEVMTRLVPGLRFGSRVADTAKGVVAHFAPPAEALARAGEPALPGWVVLPRFVPGLPAELLPIDRAQAFMHLVDNAFNYDIFGAEGFQTLAALIDRSACFSFAYGHLPQAIERFRQLADAPGATG